MSHAQYTQSLSIRLRYLTIQPDSHEVDIPTTESQDL